MKTLNKSKLILQLFAAFIVIFYSCKKADIDIPPSQNAADLKAAIIKATKERYGNISAGVITTVNRDAKDIFYRDATGNMINLYKTNSNNIINPPTCTYNCSNTTNPGDLHLVYTLSYIQRNYLCESTGANSDLNISWTISVPFTPLTSYGFNTSTGTLKVTDPGSTLHTYSNLAITIRTIGGDPSCGTNTLYEISYKALQVPDSYFGTGMTMDASLSLYNNCSLLGNLITTGDVTAADLFLGADQPCARVDKAYVVPNVGPSNCATISGGYILCTNPSGFATIDNHEVEYRLVNSFGLEWDNQSSVVYWGEPTGTATPSAVLNPYTGTSNLLNMTPSSGTWLVRYKNIKTSYCDLIYSSSTNPSPGPLNANGDWGNKGNWFLEVWPL